MKIKKLEELVGESKVRSAKIAGIFAMYGAIFYDAITDTIDIINNGPYDDIDILPKYIVYTSLLCLSVIYVHLGGIDKYKEPKQN